MVIYRLEEVCGLRDITQYETLVYLMDGSPFSSEHLQIFIVVMTAGNGLFEMVGLDVTPRHPAR